MGHLGNEGSVYTLNCLVGVFPHVGGHVKQHKGQGSKDLIFEDPSSGSLPLGGNKEGEVQD